MRRVLIIIMSACLPALASAQCDQLTRDGLFDYRSTDSEESKIQAFINWARDRRSSSSGSGTSVGASYGRASATYGQQNAQQAAQDIENYNKADTAMRSRVLSYAKTANEALAKAFNDCVQSGGLHVWLEQTDNPKVFRLAARFNNPGKNPPPTLRQIIATPGPAVRREGHRLPYQVGGEDPRWVFTRTRCDAIALTVLSSERAMGGGQLSMPRLRTADCTPKPPCDLKNANILVHYSEVHAARFLGKAVPVLEKAGASPIPTYMKPKAEKNMPNWFRVYYWPDRSDAVAKEAKRCLDTIGLSAKGFIVEPVNPQTFPPMWREYSAIVYLVDQ
jgi:hypothetical protein